MQSSSWLVSLIWLLLVQLLRWRLYTAIMMATAIATVICPRTPSQSQLLVLFQISPVLFLLPPPPARHRPAQPTATITSELCCHSYDSCCLLPQILLPHDSSLNISTSTTYEYHLPLPACCLTHILIMHHAMPLTGD